MIKVKPDTHKKLRELSKSQLKPMGDIVTELVDRYEEELFWKESKAQLDRLKADPEAWQEYLEEMAEWDDMPNEVLDTEEPYEAKDDGPNHAST
jgi:hypothetical protein